MKNYKTLIAIFAGLVILLVHPSGVFAQTEKFDLFSYKAPAGWAKDVKQTYVAYTRIDKAKGEWCQLALYKSTPSAGSVDADLDSEWQKLAAAPNHITDAPQKSRSEQVDGWQVISGAANFKFEGANSMALLTTFSGYGVCLSILAKTNSKEMTNDIYAFLNDVKLQKPAGSLTNTPGTAPVVETVSTDNSGYKFNTTNWDDGWVSTIQPDWVDVSKGNIKILLHYPTTINAANTDPKVMSNAAWDHFIAPRYRNMIGYKTAPNTLSSQRAYFAAATVTANSTGKTGYVVIFSKGNTGWVEFICPDKDTFVRNFGVDVDKLDFYTDDKVWLQMQKMAGYNKFAVALSDLTGNWTNNFGGNTYYANIYTGLSAGMSTYTSNQEFKFAGNSYTWRIIAANSYRGASAIAQGKGAGNFNVPDNWHVYFTDIEGRPKTYNSQFCAVKGGRLLILDGAPFAKQ